MQIKANKLRIHTIRDFILANQKKISLIISLLFFGLVVASFIFSDNNKDLEITTPKPLTSQTYTIGKATQFTTFATVEKTGVITILAQSSGIINHIYTTEGSKVNAGTPIVYISTSYSGGNAPALQRQLADKQLQLVEENYHTQKDSLKIQKELAAKSFDNQEFIREITTKSLSETRDQLNLTEAILSTIEDNLDQLESADLPNQELIFTTKQLKNQYLSALNSLKFAERNQSLASSKNQPPSQLSVLQQELSIKQLDIQLKSLELNKEVSRLQRDLARVSESLMIPSAPFSGTIDRIYVKPGQAINPGTPIADLTSTDNQQKTIALVPKNIATKLSVSQTVKIDAENSIYEGTIIHVSLEPTQGQLHSVIIKLPHESSLSNNQPIHVSFSIGSPDTGSALPFIPIDAVHQTSNDNYVFLNINGIATIQSINLGEIIGSLVSVESGLNSGDIVLLNRQLKSGTPISSPTEND